MIIRLHVSQYWLHCRQVDRTLCPSYVHHCCSCSATITSNVSPNEERRDWSWQYKLETVSLAESLQCLQDSQLHIPNSKFSGSVLLHRWSGNLACQSEPIRCACSKQISPGSVHCVTPGATRDRDVPKRYKGICKTGMHCTSKIHFSYWYHTLWD